MSAAYTIVSECNNQCKKKDTYSRLNKTTTEAVEALDLTTGLLDFVKDLDGPQVVNSGVDADLVETDQTSILELLLEGTHLGVDVGGCDNVDLLFKGSLHDLGVVGVRDQADNNVVTLDSLSESVSRRDVNRHGGGVGEAGSEVLCTSKCSASDGELMVVSGNVISSRASNKAGTKEEHLLLGRSRSGSSTAELGQDVDAVLEHGTTELGDGKSSSMDLRVVVPGVGNGTEGNSEVSGRVLAADHDTNLTGGVGGDGGETVLDDGEELGASFLEGLDEGEMNPQALSLGRDGTTLLESLLEELEVRGLEKSLGGTDGVRRVGDDNVVLVLVLGKELKTVTNVNFNSGVLVAVGHEREPLLRDSDDSLAKHELDDVRQRVRAKPTSSMSQRVTFLTDLCLRTSRMTPPSPPPITRTFSGLGCEAIGR